MGTKTNGKFPHKRHGGRGRDWRDADMSQGCQESPRLEEARGSPLEPLHVILGHLAFRDLSSRIVGSIA